MHIVKNKSGFQAEVVGPKSAGRSECYNVMTVKNQYHFISLPIQVSFCFALSNAILCKPDSQCILFNGHKL